MGPAWPPELPPALPSQGSRHLSVGGSVLFTSVYGDQMVLRGERDP